MNILKILLFLNIIIAEKSISIAQNLNSLFQKCEENSYWTGTQCRNFIV